jgi:hypothetical protein
VNQSGKIAFGGIITALCTVLMILTGFIPFGTYALPAIAGVLMVVVVLEVGANWAWAIFAAVSVLSFLLAADTEAKIMFILFFGYYPILKAAIEKVGKPVLSYLLKFAVFNAAMIASFFILIYVFGVPRESYTVFNINMPVVFLALGNIVFLIYDYAVSTLIMTYMKRFHSSISKLFHFK